MAQTSTLTGQIDLLALINAKILEVDGIECVVIPKMFNPSLFFYTGKDGSRKAYLDIMIRESPDNRFGNSHFIKASVGKSNRERLGIPKEDLPKYSPILGNLRTLEAKAQQAATQKDEEPVDIGDLPESFEGF